MSSLLRLTLSTWLTQIGSFLSPSWWLHGYTRINLLGIIAACGYLHRHLGNDITASLWLKIPRSRFPLATVVLLIIRRWNKFSDESMRRMPQEHPDPASGQRVISIEKLGLHGPCSALP